MSAPIITGHLANKHGMSESEFHVMVADLTEALHHEINNWDVDPELLLNAFGVASNKILAELLAKVEAKS
jgi:hypothetical protein